jgi:26S proteasome regulatory subunit N7
MASTMLALDESVRHFPSMGLAQQIYQFETALKNGGNYEKLRGEIIEAIYTDEMAPFYSKCFEKYGWEIDGAKLASMSEANAKNLEDLETKMQDAIVNAGDTEVLDLMFAKAQHFCKIGAWAEASAAYDAILAKEKTSTGKKIDATMAQTRIAMFEMVRFGSVGFSSSM